MELIYLLPFVLFACYLAVEHIPAEPTHVLHCGNGTIELSLIGRYLMKPVLNTSKHNCTIVITPTPRYEVQTFAKDLIKALMTLMGVMIASAGLAHLLAMAIAKKTN